MCVVSDVEVAVFTVPLPAPESDGTFEWDHTTVVVVQVTAGGRVGIGFTYGSAACATVVEEVLAPRVIGRDPMAVEQTWRALVDAVRNAGRPGISSMAIAAVDVALWDLKAKLLDVSLVRLLGVAREEVDVYGSGGFTSLTDDELCAQLEDWVDDGIGRVKMKIGTGWGTQPDRDVARVRAVRRAVGDDAELFVDANGAYTTKQAVRLCSSFEEAGVSWFEEPVSSDDLAGLRMVRDRTAIDIAAGEYGYDAKYFERMLAAGAVDVVQADVSRCAGISEWMRIAAIAAAHGRQVSGHCAQSLHLHPACAVDNVRHLEYFADHSFVDRQLFDGVPTPDHGTLRPDTSRLGLGLELRSDCNGYRVR